MKKRPEFELLIGSNLDYVEEHQWPPKSYLDELEAYQQETGSDEKCSIM